MSVSVRQLQLVQMEILKIVDEVCREHCISYSLYAGTLLGAVRHQGFIPWDDDLDICMRREDYNRFLQCWKDNPPSGYLLQNKETDPDFTQSFSKIRKDHTVFLQPGEEHYSYHKGIFIDIFPIDKIPTKPIKRRVFQLECMIYQLLTREFPPALGSPLQKTMSDILLKFTNSDQRRVLRLKLEKHITSFNKNHTLHTIAIETTSTINMPLPVKLMDNYSFLPFEGQNYMCISDWDEYLSLKYGNYMQLPPESERVWKHRPLIIDFERNCEEIVK